MDRLRFHDLVVQALADIPEPYQRHLATVEVVIEDEPTADTLRDMGLHRRETLFGLYEGTPLTERCLDAAPTLPDRITLFYRPLVRTFRTPAAIRREIRKTVVHELGHLFGLEDEEIEREGY